ncbi:hypothetical protein Pmani_031622 [Petrolisthes manimaculis]|uniref:Uncharacterized protein n=1 Tax=Petrolisthes manimaculis TaxID=1843537 RepID=A0AAE1NTC3_9EUCA|nr:hypothetical protein Pmani_031622 [Petrolisthes manimaculis]
MYSLNTIARYSVNKSFLLTTHRLYCYLFISASLPVITFSTFPPRAPLYISSPRHPLPTFLHVPSNSCNPTPLSPSRVFHRSSTFLHMHLNSCVPPPLRVLHHLFTLLHVTFNTFITLPSPSTLFPPSSTCFPSSLLTSYNPSTYFSILLQTFHIPPQHPNDAILQQFLALLMSGVRHHTIIKPHCMPLELLEAATRESDV